MSEITKLIKYEGDNSTFIWKHLCEDFYSSTQLIVHESQEAIFFMNGQALDLFGAGRYTLETQNIPEVSRFFKRNQNDETPFHCEVYFINKTNQMAIRWGTDTKVQYIEPTYKFPLEIGASGEMNLRAEDSRKLLLKVVGTESELSQQKLTGFFRGIITAKVKNYIAKFMTENSVNIFEVDRHLDVFSKNLKEMLTPDFEDCGVSLEKFIVTSIVKPEGDKRYEKFKEIYFRQFADIADAKLRQQISLIDQQTKSQNIILEAEAIAKKRSLEGYSYQDERSFDVAMQFAKNDSVAQFSNLGTGIGTLTGTGIVLGEMVGNLMGDAVKKAAKPTEQSEEKITKCPKCGNTLKYGDKFCSECGTALIRKCPNCGKDLSSGEKFCSEFGKKL